MNKQTKIVLWAGFLAKVSLFCRIYNALKILFANANNIKRNPASVSVVVCWLCVAVLFFQSGCKTPANHRTDADKVAKDIIEQSQKDALGHTEPFSIERPSDILRRRLLIDQNLPYTDEASLGSDKLKHIKNWPEPNYPAEVNSLEPLLLLDANETTPSVWLDARQTVKLSLIEALQVGARNSFEYQSRKEDVFQSALSLDLEQNEFRNILSGTLESEIATDLGGDRAVSGTRNSGEFGVSRKLKQGATISTAIALDLVNLLTLDQASSMGILGDATVSIPLLRGSGEDIVTEPLKQAERNVVYAIYQFERFKQTYAVSVARQYLNVLRQANQITNSEENYKALIISARRSRRLADAGKLSEIEVDQAFQSELSARNRWIGAIETYKGSLDDFKRTLNLPTDSRIDLDQNELDQLSKYLYRELPDINNWQKEPNAETPPADAPVVLVPADVKNVGKYEMNEPLAIDVALKNRLDLRINQGEVYDAQRNVVVLADALGAELTLFGSAASGSRRSIGSAGLPDAQLRPEKGSYSGLLTLDLPLERTRERDAYRNGYILLEKAVRNVQTLEDQIKLDIRDTLRTLLLSRETLRIQAQAVEVAQKRVDSTTLFLEAGRAQIRDLLEARDSLLSAQNALTDAIVGYRVAELDMQSQMGVLQVNENGLWQEYIPEKNKNAEN